MIYKNFTETYTSTEQLTRKKVEDEVYQLLSNEIQKEIDSELMLSIMRNMIPKWVEVKLDRKLSADKDWCRENISGDYQCIGDYWFFKNPEDATMFIMVWG